MHHLPSFRNSFNACDVSSAAAGEKTGFFFLRQKKPKKFAGGRCMVWYGRDCASQQSVFLFLANWCDTTVRLTPIGNPVPGYQEFLVPPSETIVGRRMISPDWKPPLKLDSLIKPSYCNLHKLQVSRRWPATYLLLHNVTCMGIFEFEWETTLP